MTKPKHNASFRGEVDWVNERVARALGLPLKFLYPPDEMHPSRRADVMEIERFTNLQRDNDDRHTSTTVMCATCKHSHEDPVTPPSYTYSQQMAMSEAWSRELREKVAESERQRTAQRPSICVEIDDLY